MTGVKLNSIGTVINLMAERYAKEIGPLHDPVTWYKITHAIEQVAQWDFQNKATRTNPL